MAYQGISPYLYRNNLTNVQLLDDISASFNGTTTQFNLTTNGSPFHAVSARSLLIILGGIVQEPDSDYTVSAGVITFTTAPLSGLTFAARNIYGLNRLTGINDGLVTPASLSLGGPEWDTSSNLTVDGNITQTGDTNNVYINTDTPTVRPTLDLNFERDQRLDSRITFSRNSTATYLGSDGLIKTALAGEPRFEFDTDGNCLGLLIEEQRTNIITNTTTYAGWSAYGSTISYNTNETLAPDGTNTAIKVTSTNTTSNFGFYEDVLLSSNTYYSHSIWLKAGTATTVGLAVNSASKWTNAPVIYVNLIDGSVVNVGATTISYKITPYPNGWYLLQATGLKNGNTNNDGIWSYTYDGGGASSYYYQWGGQIEAGSFPTSYIPTSGSAVTRSADISSISGTNLTSWYNSLEGTAYTEFVSKYSKGAAGIPAYGFKSTLNSNYYYGMSRDNVAPYHYVNTSTTNAYTYGTLSSDSNYKSVLAIKQNDINSYINGVQNYNTTSVTLFTPDIFYLGYTTSTNVLNGHIKRFTYYPQRLSNAQLQNLTS